MNTTRAKLSDAHPLNGKTVEIVRADPFKRFVIVRVLKTIRGYAKAGDEVSLKPSQVETQ